MRLRPIDKPFSTTNDLFELVGLDAPALVKVYRGRRAGARRDRERRALALWRAEGFQTPEILDVTLPELDRPYLVMTRLDGRTLQQVLARGDLPLPRRLEQWERVLRCTLARHRRAVESGQVLLTHPDASTGNVVLTDSGVYFLDLEAQPRFRDAREGAAVELGKLARWAVRDLGPQHCREAVRRVAAVYRGQPELLRRIVDRVRSRPMQFFHRWRDRRRKSARGGEVTKYDVADALAGLLGR